MSQRYESGRFFRKQYAGGILLGEKNSHHRLTSSLLLWQELRSASSGNKKLGVKLTDLQEEVSFEAFLAHEALA